MINFANSQYLLLLLLIPFFFVIQSVVLMLRKRRIRKFGDEALVAKLMPSYAKAKSWLRLVFFSLGFFFLFFIKSAILFGFLKLFGNLVEAFGVLGL